MKKIKNNITFINTITSLMLQFFTIIFGFIIPKLILSFFGSEVNGLVSSISKFLSYITLLEGGLTGVIMANLYQPLLNKNYKKVSAVIKTSNDFFKKLAIIFGIYALLLSIVYPVLFHVSFSYFYVFSLVIILSLSLFIQYLFSISLRSLLNADKKGYIVSLSQSLMLIINIVLAIISIKIFPSIHVLELIIGLMYLTQPLVYQYFIKKYYKLDGNAFVDKNLLKSRWDGFAVNIAAFIHNCTDVSILTIFCNLKYVSIYSVYSLVTGGLKQTIIAISNGIVPTIGQLYYSNDKKELSDKFDIYEFVIFVLVFLLFSVGGMLVVPFVMLYTKNINDANYYQPVFGIIILVAEAFYLIKYPHLNLAYSANKYKEITKCCYMEALLNIVISLILVKKYKLIGIAIGTLIAMIYRMIYQVYFSSKFLVKRSQWIFYKKILLFSFVTVIGVIICLFFVPLVKYSIINWLWHGVVYTVIMFLVYLLLSVLFFKKEVIYFKKKLSNS